MFDQPLTENGTVAFGASLTTKNFPLLISSHIAVWQGYQVETQARGVLEALRSRIVQLQFPITSGISQTDAYRGATRKGQPTIDMSAATGLILQQPEALQLTIHPTLAGEIPVLIAGCRADFVALVQAFTKRNEPEPISDSMGAVIIGGFNNWDRVRQYRCAWEANQQQATSKVEWQAEFQRLIPQKHLYQDRFILLSQGNYSGIAAEEMGLSESEWRDRSLTIRLEHECCHYFTKRVFGSMRNNMLDELIADYQGIVAANAGRYRADWFLRFVGLESFPHYREGGRLQSYRGTPPLSDGAFKVLQVLIKQAATNLEQFSVNHQVELRITEKRVQLIEMLAASTLEELAEDTYLETRWQRV